MNKEQAIQALMQPPKGTGESDSSNMFRLCEGMSVVVALRESYRVGLILSVDKNGTANIGIDPVWEAGQWRPVKTIKNAEYLPSLLRPKTWRFAG